MARTGTTATVTRLPDAELEVLAYLKRLGEATVAEMRAALDRQRPMTHGSMVTLLGRLEDKRLVARHRAETGKAFIYHATPSATATLKQQPTKLLERVFGGDLVFFVSSLLERTPPDEAELDELQSMLDGLKRGRGRARRRKS